MSKSIFGSLNEFVLGCHHKHEPRSRDAILMIGIFVYGLTFLDFCGNVSSHDIYKIIDYHHIIIN